MKKYVIICSIIACSIVCTYSNASAAYQDTNFTVLLGIDLLGKGKMEQGSVSSNEDTEVGITPGIEGRLHLQQQVSLGLGVRYQVPRERDEDNADEFSFVPVYGIFQFNVPSGPDMNFGLVAHLGYNFFISDLDNLEKTLSATAAQKITLDTEGGLYWGIGARITLANNITIEALYNINYGTITIEQSGYKDIDVTYKKLTLAVGYSF